MWQRDFSSLRERSAINILGLFFFPTIEVNQLMMKFYSPYYPSLLTWKTLHLGRALLLDSIPKEWRAGREVLIPGFLSDCHVPTDFLLPPQFRNCETSHLHGQNFYRNTIKNSISYQPRKPLHKSKWGHKTNP
jgi:hypothetical protein